MVSFLKKSVAIILTLTMLISVMSVAVFATDSTETDISVANATTYATETDIPATTVPVYTALVLGEEAQAIISEGGETVYFSFTPEEDGYYIFESISEIDTYGYLYDSSMNPIAENDDGGLDRNFTINSTLNAGETYILGARLYNADETASFGVIVKESPITGIEIEPISMCEKENGYFEYGYNEETGNYDLEYYNYSWHYRIQYTITTKDGTVIEGTGSGFEYDGTWYNLVCSNNQSYTNQWVVGNTYTETVSAFGVSTDVSITITESPVASVEIDPLEIIVGTKGIEDKYNVPETDEWVTLYTYYWWDNISYTVTMKNGDVVEGSGGGFYYNGTHYAVNHTHNQSYENQWEAGNTYTETVTILGCSAEASISIVEVPVVSIEFDPIEIVAGSTGYTSTSYDEVTGEEKEYFEYSWWNKLSYTVTMKDGSTLTGTDVGIEYDGEWYSFDYNNNQSYENQWTEGNTYTQKLSLMGVEGEVQISITSSPIESIVFDPISITENTDGYFTADYDGEVWSPEYYRYYWLDKLSYTVTMKNGDVIKAQGSSFEYDGEWHNIEYSDSQSYGNQWSAINNYFAEISVMGYKGQVCITIEESPVKSIEIDPISIIAGTNGNYNNDWNPETGDSDLEYFSYHWWSKLRGTVTMITGDTYTVSEGGVSAPDGWQSFDFVNPQSYENQWTAGNTYTVNVSYQGFIVPVSVTITESPLVSIAVDPIVIAEGTNCDTSYDYNPETGEWDLSYDKYYFENKLSYTLTFNDGTVIKGNDTNFMYDGEWYYINCTEDQEQSYYTPWVAGGVYTVTLSVLGKTAQTTVSILNQYTEGDYTYLVQGGSAIIIGCNSEEKTVTIPETIAGYPVIGITGLYCDAEEIIIPDNITSISTDIFYGCYNLKKVTVGAGISYLTNNMFDYSYELEQIAVSENNEYYTVVDGIVYDKAVTKMVAIPQRKATEHTVPDTVTDIEIYINGSYNFAIDLGNSNTGYIKEDGIFYNADKTIIYSCDSSKTGSYVMPDSVEEIHSIAFQDSKLTEVTVSANVTEIVYYAFSGSLNLEKVVLPDTLTSIGEGAFRNCGNLTDINIPSSLEYLEDSAFRNSGIKSAVLPATLNRVGYAAFLDSDLENLTLSEGITTIQAAAFSGTKLKNVVLPDSLATLYSSAFAYTPLETVHIGSGLVTIPESAFENTNLTSVIIPENIEYVGSWAFSRSKLKNVDFQNDSVAIGERAFYNCPIEELELTEGMTQIEAFAFYGIAAEEVDIPESVTMIAYKSFENSKNLLTIDISDNVESLCGYAFHGTAWYESQADGVVYLENSLYNYKGDMPEGTEITVKDGTKLIADYAFENDFYLKKVTIPASVEYIGSDAFGKCLNLEEIALDEGNEHFYFEDGVLYDAKYGNLIWAKPIALREFRYYKTEFEYGEKFNFGGDAQIRLECEGGNNLWLYDSFDLWFEEAPEKFVTGYDPYEPGTQTVTVKVGPLTYQYEITVAEPSVTGIELNKDSAEVIIGETEQLIATVTPEDAPDKTVYWESTDENVATVDENGLVTVHGFGSADIVATTKVGGFVDACTIIAVCGHKSVKLVPAKASTCLEHGNEEYTRCTDCGEVIDGSDEELPLAEHSYKTATTKATLTEDGKIESICKVCGYIASNVTTIYRPETIELSATSYTYNGTVRTPTVTVKDTQGVVLKEDTDYTVSYATGRKNAGTYKVTVTFKGNYSGTKELTFKINPRTTSDCTYKLSATSYTYNGAVKTPTVTVKTTSGTTLTKGTHYTVTYAGGRKNAGTYKVTVTMKGNYSGTKELTFKINPRTTSDCTYKLSATSYTYNGAVKTPTVTVKTTSGTTLKKDTHYTVTYATGRKNAGTYKVTVKMKGNYSGTKTLTFKINPVNVSKCSLKLSTTSYTYNGAVKTPTVTVKTAAGTKLTKGTHYTVTYASGRKNVGTYKVTVKMKGNYTGTKTLTFKINPPKTTVSSLTAGKKSLKVYITKKSTQVTGYQIQYSTSKSFSSYKTKNISSYKTTSTTLSGLTAKKTYYVRVRTYKTVNGVKYYSLWSAVKSQKTK